MTSYHLVEMRVRLSELNHSADAEEGKVGSGPLQY